jgi:hypothetical protein
LNYLGKTLTAGFEAHINHTVLFFPSLFECFPIWPKRNWKMTESVTLTSVPFIITSAFTIILMYMYNGGLIQDFWQGGAPGKMRLTMHMPGQPLPVWELTNLERYGHMLAGIRASLAI